MPLSEADQREIAARALRLDERLAGLAARVEPGDPAAVLAHLRRLGRPLAAGKIELAGLAARLGRPDLDVDGLSRLLGRASWPSDYPLPAWVRTLADLVEAAEASDRSNAAPAADEASGVTPPRPQRPFEHVLRPFVQAARNKLLGRLPPPGADSLLPPAWDDLSDHLLAQLSWLWALALEVEFSIARAAAGAGFGLASGLPTMFADPSVRRQYDGFVQRLREGGFPRFFREYAVLARLTALVCERWEESTARFLIRLCQDRTRWGELLPASSGPVARIATGQSDPHHGGQSVMVLTFAKGSRLVYKPRDLAVDVAFGRLLERLSPGLPLELTLPRVINCGTHGWVEFIAPAPCPDEAAVHRFYLRAGQWLALLHILGATDFHAENLIAHGEYPVLVDHETVLHPCLGSTSTGATLPGMPTLGVTSQTVLNLGLLPVWVSDSAGEGFDISGLAGAGNQDTPFREVVWEHLNTDRMKSRLERVRTVARHNRPILNGQTAALELHGDAVVLGFRAMAALLMARREELLSRQGPIAALARTPARFVFRVSEFYALVLAMLRQPDWLREGVDRSLLLELMISRAPLPDERLRPVVHDELNSLEGLDLPRFSVTGGSRDLILADGTRLRDFLRGSGAERAREGLAGLEQQAVEQQVNLIRAAILSLSAKPRTSVGVWNHAPEKTPSSAAPPIDAAACLAEARALALALATHSLADPDDPGGRSWIGFDFGLSGNRIGLKPISFGIYDGVAGVAVFLAAMAHLDHSGDAADLAATAIHAPLRAIAEALKQPPSSTLPFAEQTLGLGGILYALVRCARWLNCPELLEEARRAVTLITPAQIALDRQFDLMGGVAGLIPGLLAVYQATGEPLALARAIDCGRHLLAHMQPAKTGGAAWLTCGDTMLAGFSHGAAGIACQLVRLAQVTSDPEFLTAARSAIAYEQALFDPEIGNWPDLRATLDDSSKFHASWCHGASGIVSSRAASLGALDASELRPQIEAGLAATLLAGVYEVDSLCCGNAGRFDTLNSLAGMLARPALFASANRLAAGALTRKAVAGTWRYVWQVPRGIFHPPLFQGAAGIGYAFLRLAMPGHWPSLLLLE